MCGLFAFVGTAPDMALVRELAVKAGQRGPHASGYAVRGGAGGYAVVRLRGSLANHVDCIPAGQIIIGHSRLATGGGTSYKNLRDAQPLTLPGAEPVADEVFAHNGVANVDCGETLDTGNDSEALFRLAVAGGLAAALRRLGKEPYAVLFGRPDGIEAAHRGLPLYCNSDDGGVYLCSVGFRGAVALQEGEVFSFAVGGDMPKNNPIDGVEWVAPETLRSNSYNPNHVAAPELELLKLSIIEDGWTQPIVTLADGEIVDGFHRYMLGLKDPEVRALHNGQVPIVRLRPNDQAHQMMSTIRHNRARGTHAVLKMAQIVRTLARDLKVSEVDIMRRLGMEDEEVERLLDTGGMIERGSAAGFANGWTPA